MTPSSIFDLESLLSAIARGEQPEYLFFWGHQARQDGQIGKTCFSQWWPAAFTVDGVSYPSAEHFMMAEKARLFGDAETRAKILAAGHPAEAKKLGRMVRGFDEEIWVNQRFAIVVRGNQAKFGQDPRLRDFLLASGEKVLVEASPLDRVWGIGLTEDDPRARLPEQWCGLNLLGFGLMAARSQLRQAFDK
jgi:ribA/ribD-fused uncharacterized protein